MRVFRGVSSGIVGLVVFTVIAVPCVAEESVVASVRTIKGTAVVLRGADELAISPGDGLFASDVVRTGANGTMQSRSYTGAAPPFSSSRTGRRPLRNLPPRERGRVTAPSAASRPPKAA